MYLPIDVERGASVKERAIFRASRECEETLSARLVQRGCDVIQGDSWGKARERLFCIPTRWPAPPRPPWGHRSGVKTFETVCVAARARGVAVED